MKFSEDYPSEPPVINLLTGIPHSNIIDHQGIKNYLCIDMLKIFFWMEGGQDKSRPYSGWSPAYTIESIMLQLNSFLFDDFVENYDGKMKHTFYQLAPENGGGNRNLDSVFSDLENAFQDSINYKCNIPEFLLSSKIRNSIKSSEIKKYHDNKKFGINRKIKYNSSKRWNLF